MQQMPQLAPETGVSAEIDDRAAPRFTLLIRTAKLLVEDRQYLCIVRDISATGASIRSFHPIPDGTRIALELQNGEQHAANLVWQNDAEAGFEFHTPIDVDEIVLGLSDYPKRDLRFEIDLPVTLKTGGQIIEGQLANLSRQGGRIVCTKTLAIDQPLQIEGASLPEIEARVRWRGDGQYGLIFDTTFSLSNLALLIRNLNSRSSVENDQRKAPSIPMRPTGFSGHR